MPWVTDSEALPLLPKVAPPSQDTVNASAMSASWRPPPPPKASPHPTSDKDAAATQLAAGTIICKADESPGVCKAPVVDAPSASSASRRPKSAEELRRVAEKLVAEAEAAAARAEDAADGSRRLATEQLRLATAAARAVEAAEVAEGHEDAPTQAPVVDPLPRTRQGRPFEQGTLVDSETDNDFLQYESDSEDDEPPAKFRCLAANDDGSEEAINPKSLTEEERKKILEEEMKNWGDDDPLNIRNARRRAAKYGRRTERRPFQRTARRLRRQLSELAAGVKELDPSRKEFDPNYQHPALVDKQVDVSTIIFCQESISNMFCHGYNKGRPLTTLLDDFRRGHARPENMPALVVIKVIDSSAEVVMGHRRLWCYKKWAEEIRQPVHARCFEWSCIHGSDLPLKLRAKWLLTRTRTSDGTSVILRNR